MGVTIGSVETVLSLRDSLSPSLVKAAENVKILRDALKDMGNASVAEIEKVNLALRSAEDQFQKTYRMQMAGLKDTAAARKVDADAMDDQAEGSKKVTGAFDAEEKMAARLMERLILLAVLRKGYDFTVEVFQSADALVRLNQITDMSLSKLQDIKYAAEQTGIGFDKATTYVDTFNKKIATDSMETGEALRSLGLSVDDLFKMSADDRWDKVVASIAKISSQSQRTAIEVKLFGTDAIDPLIEKFGKLSSSSDKLSDDQIRGLSDALQAYRMFGSEVEHLFATLLVSAQDYVAYISAPAFGGDIKEPGWMTTARTILGMPLPSELFGADRQKAEAGSSDYTYYLQHGTYPPYQPQGPEYSGKDKGVGGGPMRGQEFMDHLKAESTALTPLTHQQRIWLDQMHEWNVLSTDNAEKIGVNLVQFKEYEKSLQGINKALSEKLAWDRLIEQANSIYAGGVGPTGRPDWRTLLIGASAETLATAETLVAGGMSPENVAKLTGLTVEGVKAVVEMMKDEVAQLKEIGRAIDQIQAKNTTPIENLGFDPRTGRSILRPDTVPGASAFSITNPRQPGQLTGSPLGLMPGDLGDEARMRMLATTYGIQDEFARTFQRLPAILENAFQQGGAPQVIAKVSASLAEDFYRDFSLTIDRNFKAGMPEMAGVWGDIIGIGITSGLNIATHGGSMSHQLSSSLMSGIGTGVEAYFADYMTLGASFATAATSMGVSAGIEFAYKGITYLFRDRMPEDLARDAGSKFGQNWSDELIKTIQGRAKEMLPTSLLGDPTTIGQRMLHDPNSLMRGEQAAEILSLADIMRATPVTSSNLDMYIQRTRDIFSMVATGQMTIAEATTVLDAVFPQLAKAGTDAYGHISDALRELIALNEQYGTQSKAIADWQKAQAASGAAGANAAVGFLPLEGYHALKKAVDDAQDAIDKFKKDNPDKALDPKLQQALDSAKAQQAVFGGKDRATLGDLGLQAVGAYAANVSTGMSPADAIAAQSKALSDLEQAYKDLGIEVTDVALQQLFMQNNMQKSAPTIIAGIHGLSQELTAFDNLGMETVSMFEAQERTGYAMYVRLQDAAAKMGGSTKDALMPMQEWLHNAEREAKRLGVPLDEATQMMINQSKELGIWDDKMDKVKSPTEKLTDAILDLIDALNGIPPSRTVNIDVNTRHTDDGVVRAPSTPSGGGSSGGGDYIPPYTDPRSRGPLETHAFGDVVGGNDVSLVRATPGEGIVSLAGMSRIGGKAGLSAINSGAGGVGGGDTTYLTVNVAISGMVDEANIRRMTEETIIPAIINAADYNSPSGTRTRMREALRLE